MNKKVEKLQSLVQEIVTNSKDENIIDSMGKVLGGLTELDEEISEKDLQHEKLVQNYGQAILKLGSKDEPKDETEGETPLTLSDIIKAHTKK